MKEPMVELKEIVVDGLVENIRQAGESMALRAEIGQNALNINEARLGHLFGRMQRIMGRYAVLAACRLFEPETDSYPLSSIPIALNHFRFNSDYLQIQNKEFVISKLIGFGHEASEFEGIPDPWINQLVRKEFADSLPDANQPESSDLSMALHNLKTVRDKFPPHSETVQESDDWGDTDTDINLLLRFAKDFVGTVGKGYLDIDYAIDDDNSIFEINSSRTVDTMKQLLIRAEITK